MKIETFSVQAKSGEMRIPSSTAAQCMRRFSWLRFRIRASVPRACARCGCRPVHLDMEREPPDLPRGAWWRGFFGEPDTDTAIRN